MKRKTKLPEKSVRMPNVKENDRQEIISSYCASVKTLNSESAKSHRFSILLNELFGIQPDFIENYVSGIEKFVKIKQKDRILKGRMDNLFGNLIIEFERTLPSNKREAEEQLKRYVACLWSQENFQKHTPYICLATDGLNFIVYSPSVSVLEEKDIQPEMVNLETIDKLELQSSASNEIYFWLDCYFLRKEILTPKTEHIIKDFGPSSHAFQVISSTLIKLWETGRNKSEFKVIYENWAKYLLIVYGADITDEELFIKHTYLATLAKLIAWHRLSAEKSFPDDSKISSVLEGKFFKEQGIENFLEEDFFSWISRKDTIKKGIEITRLLLSLLQNYHLRSISEDVFKTLYQDLVDPKTRHDLGEYYTPDWLAHRIVKKLLEQNRQGSFLDPSCGSGTFLYLIIREKRNFSPDNSSALSHILDSVIGIDIHPLAVIIAKTNYILALGDLIKKRKKRISIPIYLCDSIKLPGELLREVKIEDKAVYISEGLLKDSSLYDEAIDTAKDFASQNAGEKISLEQFISYLKARQSTISADSSTTEDLFNIAKTLKYFIEKKRDTIWAFILKNIYKPLFLRGKFDFIVGNPPWLSFRYAEPNYQDFLRKQIIRTYSLISKRGELITHLELGTLFFLRTAHLYLKEGGTISFVLPRSIFTADQHGNLRKGDFNLDLRLKELWDLEEVKPLFNVPACVLFAIKNKDLEVAPSLTGEIIKGKLFLRNTPFDEAQKHLDIQKATFYLHKMGNRSYWATEKSTGESKPSYYKNQFYQGATIVPRSFWFVEVKPTSLGFNPDLPPLQSSERAIKEAKKPYRDLIMQGNVEREFLYTTLLSTDLLPFGHFDYRLVVLPIITENEKFKMLDADEIRKKGFLHLADWLTKAEKEWKKRRGNKAKDINSLGWLNYRNKLTSQNPNASYRVLYNTSGTYICACLIKNEPTEFDVQGQKLKTRGFTVDYVTYSMDVRDKTEGYYLISILNSPELLRLLKPMQAKGQFGPRHICKKLLELPIPQFVPSEQSHLQLAELGKECSLKVEKWINSGNDHKIKSIGVLRAKTRTLLKKELEQINKIVKEIIKM